MATRRTMQAAVINAFKTPFQILKMDIPTPKPGQLLVKIKASGCCHTDVHAVEGDWPVKPKLPLTPGHEGAGVVEAVGEGVTGFAVGDHVGIPWLHDACGNCEYCNSGWETLCTKQSNTGYSVDGCLREYTLSSASHTIKLPQKLSFEQAAPILCAGVTSYKGIKECELKPGDFISIVGAGGGLGHLAVQYAKAMGLRPIAMDVGHSKEKYCKSLGAEFYVDATSPSAVQEIDQITHGGSHGVLCLATSAPAFKVSTDICRRKGCVVCVGLPAGTFPTSIFDIVLKRVTIRGSIVGTRQDMAEALDFAERGLVKCTVQTKRLNEINDVFSKLKKNAVEGRIVIKFDGH
jgi:propanol-preferring alcohol dehydrogenase